MAASLDSYGNYVADLHYVSNSLGGISGDVSIISGAPDANTPTWNPLVVDSNTGNYYSYYGGSWHLLSTGGGVGAGGVFTADYGGVAPPFIPTTAGAIATDSITGRQWSYYNGAWN